VLLRRNKESASVESIQRFLGDQRLIAQLVEIAIDTVHMSVLHAVLRAVLALACSECIVTVIPGTDPKLL
jgi:N-dimethylarginine dimethylaminohydrolase